MFGGALWSATGEQTHTLAWLQTNCLELYLSTSDNLVSSMVRVIKWHINVRAYNTVTLSFIASINPQRQTFHPEWPNSLRAPSSCPQPTLLKHLHLSSSIYLSIQAHLAFGFHQSVSSGVVMMLLGLSMNIFCCSVCSQTTCAALDSTLDHQNPHFLIP